MGISCELVILLLALTPYGQGKIIGGHKVAPHHRPYMVYLKGSQEDGGILYCGGFLLSDEFVMSAAHCKADSYSVFLGTHKMSVNNVGITVEKAFIHEDFNEEDFSNDLMLLKLSSKATFGRNVAPVDLAGDDTNDDTNDDTSSLPSSCSTAGWGIVTWESKHSSRVLMEANVTLIVDELCPQEVSYCSGGKTGPADGDSGGPLICEGEKAFGVVSAGRETTPGYVIHKYTKISAYRSWINVIMNITGKP